MAEFTLKRKEIKTLRVNVGDESFEIPLQGSLTLQEVIDTGTPEGTYAFLKKHVPEETFENLLMEEYNELIEIWKRESVKASGKKTGES